MFCTVCNTVFDFETGKLLNNKTFMHNPHFLALDKGVKEAVLSHMPSADAADADSDADRFKCLRLDDAEFHNSFHEICNRNKAEDGAKMMVFALDELVFWESLQRTTATMQREAADRPENDVMARMSLVLDKRLKDATKDFSEWVATRTPGADLKPFSERDYVQHLERSAASRGQKLAAVVRLQSILDVARDVMVTLALEKQTANRERMFEALQALRAQAVATKKRKARA